MADDPTARDFVLGALSPGERANVARTRLYDRDLDDAIEMLEARFGALGTGDTEDPQLWSRIGAAIEQERREMAGKHVEPLSDGEWFAHAPGIDAKRLPIPRTALLRCIPGARETAHAQEEDEHVIVIAGDLVVGGRRLATGDHLFLPIGSRHPAMHTRGGCLLLIQYR
jgi:hypothetical protein